MNKKTVEGTTITVPQGVEQALILAAAGDGWRLPHRPLGGEGRSGRLFARER